MKSRDICVSYIYMCPDTTNDFLKIPTIWLHFTLTWKCRELVFRFNKKRDSKCQKKIIPEKEIKTNNSKYLFKKLQNMTALMALKAIST